MISSSTSLIAAAGVGAGVITTAAVAKFIEYIRSISDDNDAHMYAANIHTYSRIEELKNDIESKLVPSDSASLLVKDALVDLFTSFSGKNETILYRLPYHKNALPERRTIHLSIFDVGLQPNEVEFNEALACARRGIAEAKTKGYMGWMASGANTEYLLLITALAMIIKSMSEAQNGEKQIDLINHYEYLDRVLIRLTLTINGYLDSFSSLGLDIGGKHEELTKTLEASIRLLYSNSTQLKFELGAGAVLEQEIAEVLRDKLDNIRDQLILPSILLSCQLGNKIISADDMTEITLSGLSRGIFIEKPHNIGKRLNKLFNSNHISLNLPKNSSFAKILMKFASALIAEAVTREQIDEKISQFIDIVIPADQDSSSALDNIILRLLRIFKTAALDKEKMKREIILIHTIGEVKYLSEGKRELFSNYILGMKNYYVNEELKLANISHELMSHQIFRKKISPAGQRIVIEKIETLRGFMFDIYNLINQYTQLRGIFNRHQDGSLIQQEVTHNESIFSEDAQRLLNHLHLNIKNYDDLNFWFAQVPGQRGGLQLNVGCDDGRYFSGKIPHTIHYIISRIQQLIDAREAALRVGIAGPITKEQIVIALYEAKTQRFSEFHYCGATLLNYFLKHYCRTLATRELQEANFLASSQLRLTY